jgi:hypothetical protein
MRGEEIGKGMADWGLSHGLTFEDWCDPGTATPLLRDGISRTGYNGLAGTMRGRPVLVCLYTVAYGNGDGGTETVDFTIVAVQEVRSPADGVALRPAVTVHDPFRGRAHIPGARAVELESARMSLQYRLDVGPDVPAGAVRELFEPVVEDWCVEEGNVLFELEHQVLLVARRDLLYAPEDLEDLWARTDWLLGRIVAAAG